MTTDADRFKSQLRKLCDGFLSVDENAAEALWCHYETMIRWNRKLNLTRIVDLNEAVRRHYAESLFLASLLPSDAKTAIDLGSGPGIPGYPVAVVRPECQVTLLESDQRKASFLREACGDRANVRVLCARSQTVSGEWDVVTSRAVRAPDVAELASRVSKRVLFLTSIAEGEVLAGAQVIRSAKMIPLPWDEASCVVCGDVSRGT